MVTKKLFNSREEWLQGRKNHIGGSDAAACVGLNPYKDNVQLWEEKVGAGASGKTFLIRIMSSMEQRRKHISVRCSRWIIRNTKSLLLTGITCLPILSIPGCMLL